MECQTTLIHAVCWIPVEIYTKTCVIIPLWTQFRGVYRNHSVCPFVCPSVCEDSCPAHNYFLVWHWLTIFGTWVYHHKKMCRVHSWFKYDLEFWPQGQIYRDFDMFLYLANNYFLLTIFGTWIYYNEEMWHVHSCSWFDVDLWPQSQIYRLLSCLHTARSFFFPHNLKSQ